ISNMATNLDFSLLNFASYDNYLNSFVRTEDYRYIDSFLSIRKLVKLGYRGSGKVYEESEFYAMKKKLAEFINPKPTALFGRFFKGTDNALKALMERESYNIARTISVRTLHCTLEHFIYYYIAFFQTIIFVQLRQRNGFDVSGYIDFEQSLRDCTTQKPHHRNWRSVFEGKTLLRPKKTDLSYYDWHKGRLCHNNTDNYITLRGGMHLSFMHKDDHKHIPVTDRKSKYSKNVDRILIRSEVYGHLILYDHVLQ
ncbi:hypothetical protein KR044_001145, partial [Drosophila immigrans]